MELLFDYGTFHYIFWWPVLSSNNAATLQHKRPDHKSLRSGSGKDARGLTWILFVLQIKLGSGKPHPGTAQEAADAGGLGVSAPPLP